MTPDKSLKLSVPQFLSYGKWKTGIIIRSIYKAKKDVLFIRGDWSAKVGGQEIPGVTGKFGLGVQNEAGQRLTAFCQENTLVTANTLFQLYYSCIYFKYFHFNMKEI